MKKIVYFCSRAYRILLLAGLMLTSANLSADSGSEKALVTEALFRVFRNVDTYNWQDLSKDFADEVILDYKVDGESNIKVYSRQDLADYWMSRHQGYDASQHFLGNVQVLLNGDEATVLSYVRARHYLDNPQGEDHWIIEGRYTHKLSKQAGQWKLIYASLEPTFSDGNRHIISIQQQRFKEFSSRGKESQP